MTDNIKYLFLRRLKNKYRLVILNDGTFEERVSLKITPIKIILITFILSLLLIFLTLLLFYFTPLKEYIPGKTNAETQKNLIKLAVDVDSIRAHTEERDLYLKHLKTILNGGVVKTDFLREDSKVVEKNNSLNISKEDSLFRLRVEEKSNGDYISLSSEPNIYFINPVSGTLIDGYNIENKHLGVDLVCKENSIICSVSEGVVVTSDWTKETGFVIAVQHPRGFLSFYKHTSVLLKEVGEYVQGGDPIAIVGNSGEFTSGPHLHFELWKNGQSLDPENYISF